MAKKSATGIKQGSGTTQAMSDAAPKTKAPKKKAVKAAAPKVEAKTAAPKKAVKAKVPKAAAPKAAAKAAAVKAEKAPKAPKAKAAPVKQLTDVQKEVLSKVHGSGETGYEAAKPIEERTLTALVERKLIKKGKKNKETGKVPHTITAGGKKHLESAGS